MSTTSQIVPSKNALRALRKLALGGTTVVGAIGSVSGLAFVSYDIRQRIHLAESIVETKRVIQSQPMYNTNRKAHMAAIFDMYENDQGKEGSESWRDFSRRARKHSNQQTTQTHDPEPGDIEIGTDAILHADSGKKPANLKMSSQRDLNSVTARKIIKATQKQHKVDSHTVFARPQESHNVLHVQKIITATQQQHKVDSHKVFGRAHKTQDAALPQLASSVREWLAPSSDIKQRASHSIRSKRPNASHQPTRNYASACHYSTSVEQTQPESKPPFGWSAVAHSRTYSDPFFPDDLEASENAQEQDTPDVMLLPKRPSYQPMHDAMPEQTEATSQDLDTNRSNIVTPEVSDTAQQHGRRHAEFVPMTPSYRATSNATPKRAQITSQDVSIGGANIVTSKSSAPVPDVSRELTALIEKYLFEPKEIEPQLMGDISSFSGHLSLDPVGSSCDSSLTSAVGGTNTELARPMITTISDEVFEPSPVLGQVITSIAMVKRGQGSNAARNFATQAMYIYAARGTPGDLRAIDHLDMQFGRELFLSRQIRPMCQLVYYLLSTDQEEDRERAKTILFSHKLKDVVSDDRAGEVITYSYERQAVGYIDWLCSTDLSSFKIVKEFRKAIEVVYERGVPPGEALFFPMLLRFLARGELKYLRKIFDEMEGAHGIIGSGHTRRLLLSGYARANDWEQITTEFEKMHRAGTSRKEPISYATMFNDVFREYASSEPVEKIHDFVVNAICYWGLVPISAVSATAVAAYIRHRRYDLIKEWIEAIGHLFPQVTTNGALFTLSLAKTWEEIGASCEEIEEACMSLLQGRDHITPERFQDIVQEALAGHLASKIHATKSDGEASDAHDIESGHSDDLSSQLKSAFALILEEAGDNGIIMRDTVADLLDQSNAALRLRKLLGAQFNSTAPEVSLATQLERPTSGRAFSKPEAKALSILIPPELRRELLPEISTITSLVSNHYSQLLERGERVDHAILKLACRQLSRCRRHFDIAVLIGHIYKGPAVQGNDGVMFDLEMMQLWMETAFSLKSLLLCRIVFRALVEKGAAIRLTHQFMLLAEITVQKTFRSKFSYRNRNTKNMNAEMEHLLGLLKDRFELQRKKLKSRPKRRKERKNFEGILSSS